MIIEEDEDGERENEKGRKEGVEEVGWVGGVTHVEAQYKRYIQ